jgi:hypothetical protein
VDLVEKMVPRLCVTMMTGPSGRWLRVLLSGILSSLFVSYDFVILTTVMYIFTSVFHVSWCDYDDGAIWEMASCFAERNFSIFVFFHMIL